MMGDDLLRSVGEDYKSMQVGDGTDWRGGVRV